ncbi:MAG: hypothetical protein LBQ98_08925 [Nitrososphaerota archaeon]|jgi:hypothetical protein|nr:hypothetical protein [Nitrososphaerota archaeon]
MPKLKIHPIQKKILALFFLFALTLSALPIWMLNADTKNPTPPGTPITLQVTDGKTLPPDITGDTSNWIEIATYGNYSLIIRQNYLIIHNKTTPQNHPIEQCCIYSKTALTNRYSSNNCLVRNYINTWFNGLKKDLAIDILSDNARLRNYTMQTNAIRTLGSSNSRTSLSDGFSQPTTTQANKGNDIAFALSFSEAVEFLSKTYKINTQNPSTQSSNPTASANYEKLNIPQNPAYTYGMWLRSPGNTPNTAGALSNTGNTTQYTLNPISPNKTNEYALVYPAVWVNSNIFIHP